MKTDPDYRKTSRKVTSAGLSNTGITTGDTGKEPSVR